MRITRLRRGFAAGLLAATLASCASAAADAPGSSIVHVRIHYSHFDPEALSFQAGETVTVVVENTDPIDHEFLLGDDAVQLAHERGTEAFHPPRPGEMTVPAGTTATTTYTFVEPGELILGCHLPGHYAYGMRVPITIA